MQDRLQRNFRPHRASCKFYCFRHRRLECQTPRRARERICHSQFASRRLGKHPDWILAVCLPSASAASPRTHIHGKQQIKLGLWGRQYEPMAAFQQDQNSNFAAIPTRAWSRAHNPAQHYSSGPPPALHASGAASSNRVWRARNTKFNVPVGPLRCLAMINSAFARSSSGKSVL